MGDWWRSYRACVRHQQSAQDGGQEPVWGAARPHTHGPRDLLAERLSDLRPNLVIWNGWRHDFMLKLKDDLLGYIP